MKMNNSIFIRLEMAKKARNKQKCLLFIVLPRVRVENQITLWSLIDAPLPLPPPANQFFEIFPPRTFLFQPPANQIFSFFQSGHSQVCSLCTKSILKENLTL